jgi:hypothetical protein
MGCKRGEKKMRMTGRRGRQKMEESNRRKRK